MRRRTPSQCVRPGWNDASSARRLARTCSASGSSARAADEARERTAAASVASVDLTAGILPVPPGPPSRTLLLPGVRLRHGHRAAGEGGLQVEAGVGLL